MLGLSAKIERYVFYKALKAFTLIMLLLMLVLWITEALDQIDLVTTKGQTLQLFFIMSCLAVPSLIVILAPIALLIATIYVLHTMHMDSELVVIAAAGGSPKRITRPLLWLSLLILLLTSFMSTYAAPLGLQKLRVLITQVRADLISTIMVPGAFTNVDNGLMVHIKQRNPDGSLAGVLIRDTRNLQTSFHYLAQGGAILETGPNTYLILQNGHILRRENTTKSASIVEFASYAFDLSQFRELDKTARLRTKERSTWDLLSAPDEPEEAGLNQAMRAEFHNRLAAPLYAISFPMIALLFMSNPQTTRSARGLSIVIAATCAALLRGAGFALESIAQSAPLAAPFLYVLPIGSALLCLLLLWRNIRLDFAQRFADHTVNWLSKRLTPARKTPLKADGRP